MTIGNDQRMRTIKPEVLTAEAFKPFGAVIEARNDSAWRAINGGTCRKYEALAAIDCSADGGRPVVHIYHAVPVPAPIVLRGFERHVLGSQTFMPLDNRPWLVVVALPGPFDPANVRVFRAEGRQGVHFNRGTWHHFCLALGRQSAFLVIDRDADEVDCDEIDLAAADLIAIAL